MPEVKAAIFPAIADWPGFSRMTWRVHARFGSPVKPSASSRTSTAEDQVMRSTVFTRLLVLAALAFMTITLAGCGKPEPSGIYEAKAPAGEEGTLTLEFQKDHKVKLTMTAPMGKMDFNCEYKMDGDNVVISAPAGMPGGNDITLKPTGSGYEATEGGQTMTFVKK